MKLKLALLLVGLIPTSVSAAKLEGEADTDDQSTPGASASTEAGDSWESDDDFLRDDEEIYYAADEEGRPTEVIISETQQGTQAAKLSIGAVKFRTLIRNTLGAVNEARPLSSDEVKNLIKGLLEARKVYILNSKQLQEIDQTIEGLKSVLLRIKNEEISKQKTLGKSLDI